MDEKLAALAEEIKDLNYVIIRNWETMPPLGDIDFFVSNYDYPRLLAACVTHLGDHKWFDIRQPGDNYLAENIEPEMLEGREKFGNWWVPQSAMHFASLMYHQLVHKGDHRYQDTLDKIFLDHCKPVKPRDEGVGYHDPRV